MAPILILPFHPEDISPDETFISYAEGEDKVYEHGADNSRLGDLRHPLRFLIPMVHREFPLLSQVSVHLNRMACLDAFFLPRGGNPAHIVIRHLTDDEIVATAQSFPLFTDCIASTLGVSKAEFLKRPELIHSFMSLHEYGHAYDFYYNFLPMCDSVEGAVKRWDRERQPRVEDLPARMSTRFFLMLSLREQMEIAEARGQNVADLILQNQSCYRHMPDERIADAFAASFLWKHCPDLLPKLRLLSVRI